MRSDKISLKRPVIPTLLGKLVVDCVRHIYRYAGKLTLLIGRAASNLLSPGLGVNGFWLFKESVDF